MLVSIVSLDVERCARFNESYQASPCGLRDMLETWEKMMTRGGTGVQPSLRDRGIVVKNEVTHDLGEARKSGSYLRATDCTVAFNSLCTLQFIRRQQK